MKSLNFKFFVEIYFWPHVLKDFSFLEILIVFEGSDPVVKSVYITGDYFGSDVFHVVVNLHQEVMKHLRHLFPQNFSGVMEVINQLVGLEDDLF